MTLVSAILVVSIKGDEVPSNQANEIVSWQNQTNQTQTTTTNTRQNWLYGLNSDFNILHENGTKITGDDYIKLQQTFILRMELKKSLFTENTTLGAVSVIWQGNYKAENGTIIGSSSMTMTYISKNMTPGYYNSSSNSSSSWYIESRTSPIGNNNTSTLSNFYVFNSALSHVNETDEEWIIDVVGYLNSSTPIMPYYTFMPIKNNFNNQINGGEDRARYIFVGKANEKAPTWTFEKLDVQNNLIMSVSTGAEWKMRINVSSTQFSNITIEVPMCTEPHPVNVTVQAYNSTTHRFYLKNEEQWVQDKLFLIYNQTNHDFYVMQGYVSFAYDINTQSNQEFRILSYFNVSDTTNQYYNQSFADCNSYQTVGNISVVEFAGIFLNTTLSISGFDLTTRVYGIDNTELSNTVNVPYDFCISLNQPVAITTIQGYRNIGSYPVIKQNQTFTVKTKIYGNSNIYSNLGIVGFSITNYLSDPQGASNGIPTANGTYFSNLEIQLIKDVQNGGSMAKSYNQTYYLKNELTPTGWQSNYTFLNQTEYSINPRSSNLWFTTDTWMDNNDPAFVLQTDYAYLNSANVSLVANIIYIDLNATLTPYAPNGCYKYLMIYQNTLNNLNSSHSYRNRMHIMSNADNPLIIGYSTTSGIQAYAIIPETGALDLDGDPLTTYDQYAVLELHSETNVIKQSFDRMLVNVTWEPNSTKSNDEIKLNSWMGRLGITWTTEWNNSYIWYHISDMKNVNSTEMNDIVNMVIDNRTGKVNVGFAGIAYVVQNQTWSDILAQAQANNWNWIKSNTYQWSWLWFGTDQKYNANAISNNQTPNSIDLKYEFAGLSVLNYTTQTNYFIPNSVGNLTYITPGADFGNLNETGTLTLPLNATINFGIKYENVTGTLFPWLKQVALWDWWTSPNFGQDFTPITNLAYQPTACSVDQLSFMVHFAGNQTPSSSSFNTASIKIDQFVGNWSLKSDVVDGRQQIINGISVPISGNDVLTNRSLAANYYVTAITPTGWIVKNSNDVTVENSEACQSSLFKIMLENGLVNFATVQLGSTYDWGKPITQGDSTRKLDVTSQTFPFSNFKSSYQSESGNSATGFNITSSMFFLSQIYPSWDGYSIDNDPELTLLSSKGLDISSNPSPTPTTTPTSANPTPTSSPSSSPTPTLSPTATPSTLPTSNPTQNPNPTTQPIETTSPTTHPTNLIPTPTPAIPEFHSLIIIVFTLVSLVLISVHKNRLHNKYGKNATV
jgi:hypothetical protein